MGTSLANRIENTNKKELVVPLLSQLLSQLASKTCLAHNSSRHCYAFRKGAVLMENTGRDSLTQSKIAVMKQARWE